jgi:hypothetical protein
MKKMIVNKLQAIVHKKDTFNLLKDEAAYTAAEWLYRCIQANKMANPFRSEGDIWEHFNQINLNLPFDALSKKATLNIKQIGSSELSSAKNIMPAGAVGFVEAYHAIKLDKKKPVLSNHLSMMSVGVEIWTKGRWDDNSRF